MTDLPIDLYRSILESINSDERATLLSLLVVSKRMQTEAERRLYHLIDMDSSETQQAFLERVTTSQRHADLVKHYIFYPALNIDTQLIGLIASGFRVMRNLISLSFSTWTQSLARLTISGCKFPHLKSLQWECGQDEDELILFFQEHPQLERLQVFWREGISMPPHLLLNLRFLEGRNTFIKAFLPGRCVTHLRWAYEWNDDPDEAVLEALNANIRVLSLGGITPRREFCFIAGHLQNLQVLEMAELYDSDKLISEIDRLPQLQRLIITPFWGSFPVRNSSSLAESLFQASPSLVHFYCAPAGTDQERGYYHYTRHVDDCARVAYEAIYQQAWIDTQRR